MNPIITGNLKSKTSWAAILLMALGGLEQSGLLALIPDEHKGMAISFVGALMLFLRNITTQPVTDKATGQGNANNQGGFAHIGLLLVIAALTLVGLSACQTPPHKVIETACTSGTTYSVERCVKGIAETWETYQVRAEIIAADPLTPADVKTGVQRAEAASRPVVVDMLKAGAAYAEIKQQVAAGQSEAEKLAIANANLEQWVAKAVPLVRNFGRQLDR